MKKEQMIVMNGSEKIDDAELLAVTGGESKEFEQITDWIRRNDSRNYNRKMTTNKILVVRWLKDHVPGFTKCSYHQYSENEYYVEGCGNDPLNHEQFMELIEKNAE